MLISRKLLGRYVNIEGISTNELADALTNAGLEVEGVESLIKGTNLIVGYVDSCEPHPDSDHLNICQVNIGSSVLQIVCGASNVAAGQRVVVALEGAVLPGMTIKKSSVRGVESNGMICSLSELGVSEKYIEEDQKHGIVVLKRGEPGDDPRVCLGMDDDIIDVSQTPNRSDFLSLFAVAHEVSALLSRPLTLPEYAEKAAGGLDTALRVMSDSDGCPLFYGKVINSVTLKESPEWIKAALIGCGIKPINNVVDISNLVMLETGQPIHFYDRACLEVLELNVTNNYEGDVVALDGKTYHLNTGDLVIMNNGLPVGIAGVMGLGSSMIQDSTSGIVIEIARFDRVRVRKTAQRLGLSTEASSRNSKPMDTFSVEKAMDRAVDLLVQYADAKHIEATAVHGTNTAEPVKVSVGFTKINAYLGTQLSLETVVDVFTRLYFNPVVDHNLIICTIPSYRQDIALDVDLIEEVIRVVGYDVLEETLPKLDLTMGALTPRQTMIRDIERILLGFGANQVNTYTLVDQAWITGAEAVEHPIALMSPISDKRTHLRTQLVHSLLDVATYNVARRQYNAFYFEHSKVYAEDRTYEKLALAGYGTLNRSNWVDETITLDFFALKGYFLTLVEQLGFQPRRFTFEAKEFDTDLFHPYQTASIYLDRKRIGVLGTVHPRVEKDRDLKKTTMLEVSLDALLNTKRAAVKASEVRVHPTVSRDIALLVDRDTSTQALLNTIEKASRRLLLDINVFDVFTSEKLGDKRSLAIECIFGSDHTLSDEEIQTVMREIQEKLVKEHPVTVR